MVQKKKYNNYCCCFCYYCQTEQKYKYDYVYATLRCETTKYLVLQGDARDYHDAPRSQSISSNLAAAVCPGQ